MTLRSTVLTVSVAPTKARQANVSQKEREKPKTMVARPCPTTAQMITEPRFRIFSVAGTITMLVRNEPTAGAANNQP